MRSGFEASTALTTSSNSVMSPRITLTRSPNSSNETALGLMSITATRSPRSASRRTARLPMNPVPPNTSVVMAAS